jgi:hypothetical protein
MITDMDKDKDKGMRWDGTHNTDRPKDAENSDSFCTGYC